MILKKNSWGQVHLDCTPLRMSSSTRETGESPGLGPKSILIMQSIWPCLAVQFNAWDKQSEYFFHTSPTVRLNNRGSINEARCAANLHRSENLTFGGGWRKGKFLPLLWVLHSRWRCFWRGNWRHSLLLIPLRCQSSNPGIGRQRSDLASSTNTGYTLRDAERWQWYLD